MGVVGTVAAVVSGLVTAGVALSPPVSAATVIKGCTTVANPTPSTHTNCPGASLANVNLSKTNLAYANLSGANLSNTNLSGANLTAANLSNGNFFDTNLSSALLANANLTGVNLSNANLRSTIFCATAMPDGSVNSSSCTISVAPSNPSIAKGRTQAFTATGHLTTGASVLLTNNVTWSSGNTPVATVGTSTSVATGVGVGTTTIKATAGTVYGSTVLTVGPPALTSLVTTPATAVIVVGHAQPFTATGHYTDSSTQDLTATATWSSSAATVATVGANTGVATGVGPGTATISASSGSISGSAPLSVISALGITTTSLPAAVQGAPYSQTLAASGGKLAYTWSVSSGGLPSGLTLNSSTGVISGNLPSTAGPVNFTVQVTDQGSPAQVASKALSIPVVSQLTVSNTSLFTQGVVGQAFSQSLASSVAGGTPPYNWALAVGSNPLPPGLALGGDGTISGSPTAAASYNFTVQVTDAGNPGQLATGSVSLTVVPVLSITTTSLPDAQAGTAYSQTLASTNGSGLSRSWSVVSGTLPGGLTLNASTGTIIGTPTAVAGSSSFTVQVADSGNPQQTATKALSITVVVPLTITTTSLPAATTGTSYSQALVATGGNPPYHLWNVFQGNLPPGLTLGSSSGVISGILTTVGSYPFTVGVGDNAGNSATQALTIDVLAPLTITATSLPGVLSGTSYSATLTASGGTPGAGTANQPTYEWFVVDGSLAPGLSLDFSTGVISGTPTTAGTYTFTVQVLDAALHAVNKDLSINVIAPLSITTTSLPSWNVALGQGYDQTLRATGGSPGFFGYTWSITQGHLPPGLSLGESFGQSTGSGDASPGQINSSGIAVGTVSSGTYGLTVEVSDGTQTATKALSIRVIGNELVINTLVFVSPLNPGDPFDFTYGATGGTPAYTWSIAAGGLPPGLSLDSDGKLHGTIPNPATPGTYNFVIKVTDSTDVSVVSGVQSITVAEPNNPGGGLSCIVGCSF